MSKVKGFDLQQETFENFFNSSLIGIWCFKPREPISCDLPTAQLIEKIYNSVCVQCNKAYADMINLKKEDIIGMKLSEFLPDNRKNRAYLKKFINNDFCITGGISHEITPAGTEKYFSNSFKATIKDGWLIEAWGTQNDVTEVVITEQQLKAVNANLTAMLENTDDFIMIADKEGYPIVFNTAYANIMRSVLGIEMKPGIKPHTLLKNKKEREVWDEFHRRVLSGEKFQVGYELKIADISKYLEISFYPIRKDGKIAGFTELSRDISERKYSEDLIREQERTLRQIIDLVPHFIFAKDSKGSYIIANKAVADNYNTTTKFIIGKKDEDFSLNQEEVKQFLKDDLLVIKTGRRKQVEETVTNSKGEVRYMQTTKIPFSSSGKKRDAVLGVSVDITDLKTIDQQLRVSEEKFRSIVEFSQEGILIVADNYRISYVNEKLCEMLGYEESRFIDADFREFLTEKSLDLVVDRYLKRRKGKEVKARYEIELIKQDGSIMEAEISNAIIKDAENIRTITQVLDITQRKRDEKVQKALYSIASAVNTAPDLDDLFSQIKLYLQQVIDTTNFLVVLYDDKRNLLSLNYNVDEKDDFKSFPPGKTLTNYVIQTGKSLLADDKKAKELEDKGLVELVGTASKIWMGVPLRIKSKIIGVVVVQSYDDPHLYSEKDLEIMEIISYEIAQAIQHKKTEQEIKASLREKEILLKEIHHRVKNNLQIISSLLNMQSREIKDTHMIKLFRESQNRVKSMAIIHHKLYENEDITNVDFNSYIRSLSNHLFHSFKVDSGKIRLLLEVDDFILDVTQAIPLGLIINEIISNSIKYAFPENMTGEIRIKAERSSNGLCNLIISDNGIGIKKGLKKTNSMGINLIDIFVNQIHGNLDLDTSKGVTYKISFQVPSNKTLRNDST
jgi:PAS domain S-box-containing protein